MEKKKKRLGRGLNALIKSSEEFISCKLDLIDSNSDQPRKDFDEKRLKELSESIKEYGVIQPVIVKREGERFRIIAGERRVRAAKMAGLKTIKASVFRGEQDYHVSLIENIQRENLNPMEIAMGYEELMQQCNYTQKQLSEKVGRSRSEVANYLRLLKLSEKVRNLIVKKELSMGRARPLAILNHSEQNLLSDKIINERLSARQVEKLVKTHTASPSAPSESSSYERLSDLEKNLQDTIPADINIRRNK
ncbi:MAG: ParB/RepB/Spo0J family partition protein, partial [bacterium]